MRLSLSRLTTSKFSFISFLLLFLLSRVVYLLKLPIFNDEAIYLNWAALFKQNSTNWVLPLAVDGKQPGLIMLQGIFSFLPIDPLLTGRLLSVGFALLTFINTLAIGNLLLPKKNQGWLALLLIFSPFMLIFDRLALMESALASLYTLLFRFYLIFRKRPLLRHGIYLGGIVAIGWWIKFSFLLVLFPLLVSLLHLLYKERKIIIVKSVSLMLITILALIIPLLIYPLGRDSSPVISRRIFSPTELLSFPFTQWAFNITSTVSWLVAYLTPLVFICLAAGLLLLVKKRSGYSLLIWTLLPLIIALLTAKLYTSRYIYFVVPFLVLIAFHGLSTIQKSYKYTSLIVMLGAGIPSLLLLASPIDFYKSYLEDFRKAKGDYYQYVGGWTSGYGLKEVTEWIRSEVKNNLGIVFLRSDYGNPESALQLYFHGSDNIQVRPISGARQITIKVSEQTRPPRVFFVSRGNQLAGLEQMLQQRALFPKPLGKDFIGIYEIEVKRKKKG